MPAFCRHFCYLFVFLIVFYDIIQRKFMVTKMISKQQTQILPKSLWQFYLRYAIPGSGLMLGLWMLFLFILSMDGVLFPNFQRWFVALFETPIPDGVNFIHFALPTILLITGLSLMISISALLRSVCFSHWSPQVKNRISVHLNDYVHSQSMSFWTGRMPGKINAQIGYVANGFSVIQDFWRIVCLLITVVLNVGLILSINSYVAIIFGTVFLFRTIYSWRMVKPLNNASKDASGAASELSGHTVDSLSNFSIVKMFAGAKNERKYLAPSRTNVIKTNMHAGFISRIFWGVPLVIWDLCYGATLLFCVYLYVHGEILISEIVFTTSVYFNVMGTISMIVNQIPDITDKIGSATKAYNEINTPITVQDMPDAKPLNVVHGEIEIKNVSFKYKNKYILRNFSLKIKPGERVGLVGSSGAGKTTLVNLLMRFYDPNHGQILIDGTDIATITQDSLRENIAFIPQEPTMFNRTLRENIEYGRLGATDSEIRRAARLAAADKFIMGTEKKYETRVGDRGIKLSGGQRQRIAIARAFLKNAPILILDEATSALDSETEVAIQESFDKLAHGRTTIAIAHRLSTLRNMDRIIVMDHGHVIESGTHKSLLRRRGHYANLWKMQSGGFLQE